MQLMYTKQNYFLKETDLTRKSNKEKNEQRTDK